jgi:hypothetical protein
MPTITLMTVGAARWTPTSCPSSVLSTGTRTSPTGHGPVARPAACTPTQFIKGRRRRIVLARFVLGILDRNSVGDRAQRQSARLPPSEPDSHNPRRRRREPAQVKLSSAAKEADRVLAV